MRMRVNVFLCLALSCVFATIADATYQHTSSRRASTTTSKRVSTSTTSTTTSNNAPLSKSVQLSFGSATVSSNDTTLPSTAAIFEVSEIALKKIDVNPRKNVSIPLGGLSVRVRQTTRGAKNYFDVQLAPTNKSLCATPFTIIQQLYNGSNVAVASSGGFFLVSGDYCRFRIYITDNKPTDLDPQYSTLLFKVYLAAAAGGGGNGTNNGTNSTSAADVDLAILNFALNLEYLEAEFYLAAVGRKPSYESQVTGKVTGGKALTFASEEMRDYANEIAQDEENHVLFLRQALGDKAVDRPAINIGGGANGSFGIAASAAGKVAGVNNATQQALATFSPYASELFFLHGAFIFEDVGVTAYKGAAPLVSNKGYLEAAAGILAVEAYHAATVRTLLYAKRNTVAVPAGAVSGSTQLQVKDIVGAISALRALLGNGKDQSIVVNGAANIVPTDANSVAFSRTPREVLNIVYGAVNATKGLFFPNGLNGDFSALLK